MLAGSGGFGTGLCRRVVPGAFGAALELTHTNTGRIRKPDSTEAGNFAFNGIESGQYSLSVTMAGFKKFGRGDIVVGAGQRLDLGASSLEVSAVSETVTVRGELGAVVATQSSERADIISSRQVNGLLNLGRNITALVQLAPGVVVTRDSDALSRNTDFNVNGSRRTMRRFQHKMIMRMDRTGPSRYCCNFAEARFDRPRADRDGTVD